MRRVTIGSVGKIEADVAREQAKRIVRQAELGQDFAAEKAKARAERTLSEICDLYLIEGCDTKKPSTLLTDKGHIKPLLGKKRIGEITRSDVGRFMRDVAAGRPRRTSKRKLAAERSSKAVRESFVRGPDSRSRWRH